MTSSRRARVVVFLVIGVAVALALYLRWGRPLPVQSHQVKRGDIVVEAFGRGTIESEREAELGFDLVGRIATVLVSEGQRVTLGQELAHLAPDQVQADLGVAALGVEAARASLQRLATEEKAARTGLKVAERESARGHALSAQGVLPEQGLEALRDQVRIRQAELDRVLAQRLEATRSINVAAGGATQRRVTVARATLLAPFDGLVTRRFRDPGDTAGVGTTVLRLADTGEVYVRAWLDETVLRQLQVDQSVEVFVSGSAQAVPGRVIRVGWESDRQTHSLPVDVALLEPPGRIAIGQRADVRIAIDRQADALGVPLQYVQHAPGQTFCYVDRKGKIAKVPVRLGAVGRQLVEVKGLDEDSTVLLPTKAGATLETGRRWTAP